MKHELFFTILASILIQDGDRVYHKHSWKDDWVNVSKERIGLDYVTNNKLYISTDGPLNGLEKITVRVDRFGVRMTSYQNVYTDYSVDVDCGKKQAMYTRSVYRNSNQEITMVNDFSTAKPQKFDDSHLFGAVCVARALSAVLEKQDSKNIDSCDFRQQVNGNNPVRFENLSYIFPIRWDVETCRAIRSAMWLYSIGQTDAAKVRLAWVPSLTNLVKIYM